MRVKDDVPYELQFAIGRFSHIIDTNNSILESIAGLQKCVRDRTPVPYAFIVHKTTAILVDTFKMIKTLNDLHGNRYSNLFDAYEDIASGIKKKLGEKVPDKHKELLDKLVLPFDAVDNSSVSMIGEKIAFLCDMKNKAGVRVPDGFAVTESAYKLFISENGLEQQINGLLERLDFSNIEHLFQTSSRLRNIIIRAPVPPRLKAAIGEAFGALKARSPSGLRVSVRSSGLFESNAYTSFAGQYRSVLNIDEDEVLDAYREVIASKFTPEALIYASVHGYALNEISMCAAVQCMIDADVSGVLYTTWQKPNLLMIQSVYGLGLYVVNGTLTPDSWLYDKNSRSVISSSISEKPVMLKCSRYGIREEKVTDPLIRKSCLSGRHITELARIGRKLERRYGMPLDIEWAVDGSSNLYFLQCRARVSPPMPAPKHEPQDVPDLEWAEDEQGELYVLGFREPDKRFLGLGRTRRPQHAANKLITETGVCASPGVAGGTAFMVDNDVRAMQFPAGGIILCRTADPKLTVLLGKAAGILAGQGSVTGHLATVARELGIPALFSVDIASIPDNTSITMDADHAKVYDGTVRELLAREKKKDADLPAVLLLKSLLQDIAVLNIPNPLNSNAHALKCRTIHDLVRFVHQTAIEEMFKTCDSGVTKGCRIRTIVTPIPMNLIAFDLGGGIAADAPENNVPLGSVLSIPMQVLWRGMMHKGIKWSGERNINVSGLVSAMTSYLTDQSMAMRGLGSPSYVFLSKNYLNLNSRVGYHFATVDASIGEHHESNYINFRFSGGANALDRRSRRTALIEKILGDANFVSLRTMDIINSRIQNLPEKEMEEKLEFLGRVLGFVNRLDISLVSDTDIDKYYRAFREQRYDVL